MRNLLLFGTIVLIQALAFCQVTPGETLSDTNFVRIGYYTQWSIYNRLKLSELVQSGAAATLTHIVYAFAKVTQDGLCSITATGGDTYADYTKAFTATDSISGTADKWNQPLRGNFNQLRQLKVKYPNIKVIISIGGGTGSTYFSNIALTDTSRKSFVSSCIDIYIKGNLPSLNYAGGDSVALSVFDGIDVDWEYPAFAGSSNAYRVEDTQTFTLLLQEFRRQLDAFGAITNKRYELSAAFSGVLNRISKIEVAKVNKILDFFGIMAYDFKGSWNSNGPTDFHSNLYADYSANPYSGDNKNLSIASAVDYFMAAGASANKIVVGIPYYGRGWTGVSKANNGLYQTAKDAASGTYESGIDNYKVIVSKPGTVFHDSVTKQAWKYDGSNWWSYDDPQVIAQKTAYIKNNGLAGTMVWTLDGEDSQATLSKAIYNGLTNSTITS